MAITVKQVETILVERCGNLMQAAGMDTLQTGSNPHLTDPIGWAIRQCSGTVADVTRPTDADLNTVTTANVDQFLDFAELRTLETISGNLSQVNIQAGPMRQDFAQLGAQVEQKIQRIRTKIEDTYGIGVGNLNASTIDLDFHQLGA